MYGSSTASSVSNWTTDIPKYHHGNFAAAFTATKTVLSCFLDWMDPVAIFLFFVKREVRGPQNDLHCLTTCLVLGISATITIANASDSVCKVSVCNVFLFFFPDDD